MEDNEGENQKPNKKTPRIPRTPSVPIPSNEEPKNLKGPFKKDPRNPEKGSTKRFFKRSTRMTVMVADKLVGGLVGGVGGALGGAGGGLYGGLTGGATGIMERGFIAAMDPDGGTLLIGDKIEKGYGAGSNTNNSSGGDSKDYDEKFDQLTKLMEALALEMCEMNDKLS